jgi:hypothetical protein
MTSTRFVSRGKAWCGLAALSVLVIGCQQQGSSWDGIYTVDRTGGARVCTTQPASPADGQNIQVPMQVSNEGGWCGIPLQRGGVPFDSYLMVSRAQHGRVFAHRVGGNTRLDYTPDPAFTGADTFTVRLLPGDATVKVAVTVTP